MLAITLLTLKRVREPAFFIFLGIAMVLAYAVSGLDPISQQLNSESIFAQVVDAGRSTLPLLSASFVMFIISAVLGGFLGAAEIPRDISSDLILILLSKPIRKISYMLGKYFGMLVICIFLYAASLLVIFLAHWIHTGEIYSFLLLLKQLYLILAFLPFCGMIIMISCYTGELAAMVVSFFYLIFSLSFSFVPIAVAMLPKGVAGYAGGVVFILYYFFPNFIFYFQDFKMFGLVSLMLLIYSVSLSIIFLLIAVGRLETRDYSKNSDL
ncbi:MAG: ABC-2 family transporter protein [Lentisphaerae bacterium ADurb.Bin242]|nr:MAG: ABC-2 family transporter protein [Lentisphaerae bacterium ADurb.Bin242]